MYGRWVLLGVFGLMMVIEFFGSSIQVYNGIMILLIGSLSLIEVRKFIKDKHAFRLIIVIPLIIAVIFSTPMLSMLSKTDLIFLKVFGVVVILLYFFYDYKTEGKR